MGGIPVHVGTLRTEVPDRRPGRRIRRSPLIDPGIDWTTPGFVPRWLGMESSDCAVALEPSIFHGRGAEELTRFLAGTAGREEIALVVTTVGDVADDGPRSVLSTHDASIGLPGLRGMIYGRRLPAGSRPVLASDASPADRDLGLRLLDRPADAPWWSLSLNGLSMQPGAGGPPEHHRPEGELRPILVDGLGDPVVAAWIAPGQRWYIVPDVTDWNALLEWLIRQALPAYVPNALRRARSPHFADTDLQTQAESAARLALAELEARCAAERASLTADLERAESLAEPIRYGLLYGTGRELVDAVDAVLTAAGFATEDLDKTLGGTRSADLLAVRAARRLLVEVKSATGNSSESLVGDLQRHLSTWPALRPDEPADGVLIVNQQHRMPPQERSTQVYQRREFVASLNFPVISTRALLDWWRVSDWAAIRSALLRETALGAPDDLGGARAAPAVTDAMADVGSVGETPGRRRWWRAGRSR